jgi:hypothetical protein
VDWGISVGVSQFDDTVRGSAIDVLPAALTITYVILCVHGLLLLAGWELTLSGPALTPAQCFTAAGLYLVRRLLRQPQATP